MSDEESLKNQVRDQAKLSLLTDKISSMQEKNLKMYPFVFFEDVTSAEIHYDLSNDLAIDTEVKDKELKYKFGEARMKHLKVIYKLNLDERLNNYLDKRFQAIESSVRNLFWKEVAVEVYFNGKQVYKSV